MSNKKPGKPRRRGPARVPVILQLERRECGAACLAMIMAYYGKRVSIELLRPLCGGLNDGVTAKNIVAAAREQGLNARNERCETETVRSSGSFPCIVFWNFNHFVVLDGFKGGKAVINDPEKGVVRISMDEFDRAFAGLCIFFEPGESFVPDGKERGIAAYAKKQPAGTGMSAFFVVASGVIAALMAVVYPGMNRILTDKLLDGGSEAWTKPYFLILAGVMIASLCAQAVREASSVRLGGLLTAQSDRSYMRKVLSLPIEYFSLRTPGSLLRRRDGGESLADSLVYTVLPGAVRVASFLLYAVILLRYSTLLGLLGLAGVWAGESCVRHSAETRENLIRARIRDSMNTRELETEVIDAFDAVKAGACEDSFFARWASFQSGAVLSSSELERLSEKTQVVPALICTLTSAFTMVVGVAFVRMGSFTVGMAAAFQGLLSAVAVPVITMSERDTKLRETRVQLESIEDVMDYPSDPNVASCAPETHPGKKPEYKKLTGSVEIKNLSFGYSKQREPVISEFNLTIKKGSLVALVGPSGSGKSTLVKLISGLYTPWSGEILFDGKAKSEIDRNVFAGSFAALNQGSVLFADTLANNIRMWDRSIEDFEVIMAARDAKIHDDIMQRPGGYNSILAPNGADLSGGQRQRLEIARVLAQDPTVVIMDEATSVLDARTEYEILESLRDRGITCIIVTHRLSALRECDEVIVLRRGEAVQRGTHEQLAEQDGLYRRLLGIE